VLAAAYQARAVGHPGQADRLLDRAGHAEQSRELVGIGRLGDAAVGGVGILEGRLEAIRGHGVDSRLHLAQASHVRLHDLP
jgi:hypothetical protein